MNAIFKQKDCSLFVQGFGLLGILNEVDLPFPTMITEDHRGSGQLGPIDIDMGNEKMEMGFDLSSINPDVIKLYGIVQGRTVPFRTVSAEQDELGNTRRVEATVGGFIKGFENSTLKPGEASNLKPMVSIRTYKLSVADEVLFDLDFINGRRVVNGVDQWEAIRNIITT